MTRGERRALLDSIARDACEREGRLPADLRRAACDDPTLAALPGPLAALARKIRDAATTVTDADIEEARKAGFEGDAIYELTVTTALGESRRRLQSVLRALGRES
jgi:alkylhydroperoxidase family enzyme